MSETQARSSAPRGRGYGRGGRGGHNSTRGGRSKQAESEPVSEVSYEDQGEIGQLKKKHALNIITIKEMFPQFSEDDIVFALEESSGDMERTVERMTEGNVAQWGEVKKKTKEKVTPKSKDALVDSTDGFSRGGRSRGTDGGRNRGGRGGERGRGRGRVRDTVPGRKALEAIANSAPTNGDTWDTPVEKQPANEVWDQAIATSSEKESGWDMIDSAEAETPVQPAVAIEQPQPSSKPDGTRTWASMFAQKPKPKPVIPTPKITSNLQTEETPTPETITTEIEAPTTREEPPIEEASSTLPTSAPEPEPAVDITPSEDQLTESNLQQVPGSPQQPATTTVVSNAGTGEIRTGSSILTPVPGSSSGHQPIRPGLGGFQTSALKATTPTPRTPSFARRVKEQQEAVVMPGNHAVDRTAVQFGSLGLGSSSADLDADDDREQPETRAQPPQHSPVAPKASLPTSSQPSQPDVVKAAPGLAAPGSYSASQDQQSTQSTAQSGYPYNQYGNYGYPGPAGDGASGQKGYEPFGQQTAQTATIGGSNGYPSHSQAPTQTSQQSHFGGATSTANDYSSYYTADQQRNAYNQYYGAFGQTQGGHDQKNAGSYGVTSATELPATTATSQAAHPSQTRLGVVDQNSGHSTPNPPNAAQTQGQQGQQHVGHGNQHGGYPYGGPSSYYGNYYPNYMGHNSYGRERPPFDDVRRYEEQYLSQSGHYGYGGNHGGYGGGPYAGGKYGQPQGYGMPSQTWDGHAGSPANSGSYGQQQQASGRDASTHGSYGRAGSTQPSEGLQQQSGNSYGASQDVFGRAGAYGQGSHQQGQQATDESSRGYNDSSKGTGPSPVPTQNAGRPASAANAQGQGSQAQTYGGYPSQTHYGSGYGHQNSAQGHQTAGYSGYGGFGNSNYYNNNNNTRGNWGGNYGQ